MTTTFATGTNILTARGEAGVETLHDGDAVETVSGAFRPVVFLGRRRVDCVRHPRPRDVWPVRIRADAFADGLPRRDLLLSPDHAIYIDDVLIPIRCLINGTTIIQETTDEIVYWHVELADRDVIFAEGLPCESCPDANNRSAFENGGKVMLLYPDFASSRRETDASSRLTATGDTLAKVRRYLLGRTEQQGTGARPGAARGNVLPG